MPPHVNLGKHAGVRAHQHSEFDLDRLLAAKGSHTVSVCLPARDEESTVAAIVTIIRAELESLIDEVIVIDDHSTDHTAAVARSAGARVVAVEQVLASGGPGEGKGEALWKSVHASSGDIIVWCDADVTNFGGHFVLGLLGPLLLDPTTQFVKGFYQRPYNGMAVGGGRVTELVSRPLLSLYFPELGHVVQPLAGEYAGRRSVLESVPFVQGYGVDVALLIDIARKHGVDSIAQVDLGTRIHRNRPLDELGPMAMAVTRTILARAGVPVPEEDRPLIRVDGTEVYLSATERPSLITVAEYLDAHPYIDLA